jgi:hypothetical protein
MSRLVPLVLLLLAACSGGFASSDPRTGTSVVALQGGHVPPGARLWLQLDALVDDQAPPGTTFTARVAGHVFSPSGDLLIPRGAAVVGRVVAGPWLVIDHIELGGVLQPLPGWVVGVEPAVPLGTQPRDRRTADEGLDDDLPTGTRLELRLVAPAAPLAEREA